MRRATRNKKVTRALAIGLAIMIAVTGTPASIRALESEGDEFNINIPGEVTGEPDETGESVETGVTGETVENPVNGVPAAPASLGEPVNGSVNEPNNGPVNVQPANEQPTNEGPTDEEPGNEQPAEEPEKGPKDEIDDFEEELENAAEDTYETLLSDNKITDEADPGELYKADEESRKLSEKEAPTVSFNNILSDEVTVSINELAEVFEDNKDVTANTSSANNYVEEAGDELVNALEETEQAEEELTVSVNIVIDRGNSAITTAAEGAKAVTDAETVINEQTDLINNASIAQAVDDAVKEAQDAAADAGVVYDEKLKEFNEKKAAYDAAVEEVQKKKEAFKAALADAAAKKQGAEEKLVKAEAELEAAKDQLAEMEGQLQKARDEVDKAEQDKKAALAQQYEADKDAIQLEYDTNREAATLSVNAAIASIEEAVSANKAAQKEYDDIVSANKLAKDNYDDLVVKENLARQRVETATLSENNATLSCNAALSANNLARKAYTDADKTYEDGINELYKDYFKDIDYTKLNNLETNTRRHRAACKLYSLDPCNAADASEFIEAVIAYERDTMKITSVFCDSVIEDNSGLITFKGRVVQSGDTPWNFEIVYDPSIEAVTQGMLYDQDEPGYGSNLGIAFSDYENTWIYIHGYEIQCEKDDNTRIKQVVSLNEERQAIQDKKNAAIAKAKQDSSVFADKEKELKDAYDIAVAAAQTDIDNSRTDLIDAWTSLGNARKAKKDASAEHNEIYGAMVEASEIITNAGPAETAAKEKLDRSVEDIAAAETARDKAIAYRDEMYGTYDDDGNLITQGTAIEALAARFQDLADKYDENTIAAGSEADLMRNTIEEQYAPLYEQAAALKTIVEGAEKKVADLRDQIAAIKPVSNETVDKYDSDKLGNLEKELRNAQDLLDNSKTNLDALNDKLAQVEEAAAVKKDQIAAEERERRRRSYAGGGEPGSDSGSVNYGGNFGAYYGGFYGAYMTASAVTPYYFTPDFWSAFMKLFMPAGQNVPSWSYTPVIADMTKGTTINITAPGAAGNIVPNMDYSAYLQKTILSRFFTGHTNGNPTVNYALNGNTDLHEAITVKLGLNSRR